MSQKNGGNPQHPLNYGWSFKQGRILRLFMECPQCRIYGVNVVSIQTIKDFKGDPVVPLMTAMASTRKEFPCGGDFVEDSRFGKNVSGIIEEIQKQG